MTLFSTLDRYLLRKFFGILFFAAVAMTAIFIAVNYVENTDKFIDRKVPGNLIFEFYLNYIPHIVTLTLPVDVLLACLFSVGSLSRFNELIAIKSAGISIYRIMMPVFAAGLFISAFDFWLSEYVVPTANIRRTDIWDQYVAPSAYRRHYSRDITLYDPSGAKATIERFDKGKIVAKNISIQYFYGTTMTRRIDAIEAAWDSVTSRWVFRNGSRRAFHKNTETVNIFGEYSAPDIFFTPEDILKRERNPEEMNFLDLKRFIRKLHSAGSTTERWEVDYQLKFSYPLTCLLMVFFGAPLAAMRGKSGAGINVFLTLVVCFGYWVIIQLGRYMGYNQTLTPLEAAWTGNLLFALIGLNLTLKVRT